MGNQQNYGQIDFENPRARITYCAPQIYKDFVAVAVGRQAHQRIRAQPLISLR
jgi:hypothetical protein